MVGQKTYYKKIVKPLLTQNSAETSHCLTQQKLKRNSAVPL
jgi:hypothetical protein